MELCELFTVGRQGFLERRLLLRIEREIFFIVGEIVSHMRERALPCFALCLGIRLQAVVEDLLLDGLHAVDDVFDRGLRLADLARQAARFLAEFGRVRLFIVTRGFQMLALCHQTLAKRFASRFFLREKEVEIGAVFCETRAERLCFFVAVELGERGSG